MYLKFSEVILVANKGKVDPEDPIIYVREYNEYRILTTYTTCINPNIHMDDAVRYGRLYYDTKKRPCVVPDVWTWDDAHQTKDCIPPEDPIERSKQCTSPLTR